MFILTRLTALLSIGLLFVLLATAPAEAAEPAETNLAALRAALADGRAERLADQVQLPFLFEGRAEDRAGFVARVAPRLFTPSLRRCLRAATPQPEDGRLTLHCAPYTFYLGRDAAGRWRIAEFGADGEA